MKGRENKIKDFETVDGNKCKKSAIKADRIFLFSKSVVFFTQIVLPLMSFNICLLKG